MLFKFLVNDFLKIVDGRPINGMITAYFFSAFIFWQLLVVISFYQEISLHEWKIFLWGSHSYDKYPTKFLHEM